MVQKIINRKEETISLESLKSSKIVVAVKGSNPKSVKIFLLSKVGTYRFWTSLYSETDANNNAGFNNVKDAINEKINDNYSVYNCSNTSEFVTLVADLKGGSL